MAATPEASFADRVVTETEAYTGDVVECVRLVSELLEAYTAGGAYEETAAEIGRLETDCDRRNRRITGLITNATVEEIGLRNTRLHINSSQIIDLYQRLDRVANAAERIADELVAIDPARTERYVHYFGEMTDCATTAAAALERAVTEFVRLLCVPTESGSVAGAIRTVRDAESRCDGIRNDAIATAFTDQSVARALLYRELIHLFDSLVDAVEDVTDQLVLVSSSESGIETEPGGSAPAEEPP